MTFFCFPHPTRITTLISYENTRYFADETAIYCITFGPAVRLCDAYGEPETEFAIHNGRLYCDLSDFTKFISLPIQN